MFCISNNVVNKWIFKQVFFVGSKSIPDNSVYENKAENNMFYNVQSNTTDRGSQTCITLYSLVDVQSVFYTWSDGQGV